MTKPVSRPRKQVTLTPKLIERDKDVSNEDEFVVTEITTRIHGDNAEADLLVALDESSISDTLILQKVIR